MTAQFANSLVPKIRAILASADLTTISAKGVRKQLIAQGYDADRIKSARPDIDAHIATIFDSLTANNAPSSLDEPIASSSRSNGYPSASAAAGRDGSPAYAPQTSQPVPLRDNKPSIKSDPYGRVKDEKPSLNPASAYGTASAGTGRMETDEEMAARLQAEFDTANSSSSRTSRARASGAAGAGAGAKKKKTAVKRKSAATVGSDGEEVEKKKRKGGGGGAFNKEMILSDALSALVGETRLSRPQTVKRIWDYVKAGSMQDPADKRYILCDDRLQSVFHTDRLHMFTMNKILAEHFMDPAEVVGGEESKPKLEAKPRPTGTTVGKMEPISGAGTGAVPAGRSAEIVYSDEDEDDEDDDY